MELKKYKIKDVCFLNHSSINSQDENMSISYLDTSNITNGTVNVLQDFKLSEAPSRAQRKVKHNTIIYSTVRPNLKHFGILKNPKPNIIVSTGFTTLDVRDEKAFSPDYIYYLLTQQTVVDYLQIVAQNNVSAYPSINPSDIGNLTFTIPVIEKQKQIAKILSDIDCKIELNRAINRNLEAMAKQLYDYWFVQFDFPNEDGKPYKSSGGEMVWNEKLKREIPMEWSIQTIESTAEVYNGATPSTTDEENYGGNIVWITPKDLSNQQEKFVYQGERNISQKGYDSCSTHLLPSKSVLMSSRAPIGLLAISRKELCTNQGFKSFVAKSENMATYLYYYLQIHIKQIEQLGTGTTFKEVSRDDILKFQILKPTDSLLDKWEEVVSVINDRQLETQKENESLIKQRDELLPLLMNGQVSVNCDLSHG